MKPIWNKINKALGIINLIVGLVIFYVIFDMTQKQIIDIEKLSEKNGFPKIDTSFFELFLSSWIYLLIGILFIASGILVISTKKLGWVFGYSCWIIMTLMLIPITLYGIRDVTVTTIGPEYLTQIYSGIGILASLILLIILSLKPIRIINKVNRNSWFLSFGIVLLINFLPRIL